MSARKIAIAILGPIRVRPIRLVGSRGLLAKVHGDWAIAFHPDAPDQNFIIAHELGHLIKRLWDLPKDTLEEEDANRIAAALLAPPRPLEDAHRAHAGRIDRVARTFDMTQSATILRTACVRRTGAAVVAPIVRVIPFGGFQWPEEMKIRRWASGEERTPRGLKKTRLTGAYDRGRIALRVS